AVVRPRRGAARGGRRPRRAAAVRGRAHGHGAAARGGRRARRYCVTLSVPTIPGWMVHSYLTVPAAAAFQSKLWPLPKRSDLKSAPLLATVLWSTVSSLTQ